MRRNIPLYLMFLEESQAYGNDHIDLAITCIVNALCCRGMSKYTRRTLISILAEMQAEQRRQWREGKR